MTSKIIISTNCTKITWRKRLVKDADAQNERAAEGQLRPAGIGDLARHFVGDHHRTQRINSGSDGVENEQRGQPAVVSQFKVRAEQGPPQETRDRPQANNQGGQNQKHHAERHEQHWPGFPIAGTGRGRHWKHGVDHGPRAHIDQSPDQRDRSIDSGLGRHEEVIDQDDVEVVDDDLAGEKHNRL